MSGRDWKLGEERRLAELLGQGLTHQQIADELGRTKACVQSHVQTMRRRDKGYTPKAYHKWTSAEQERLMHYRRHGLPCAEIAERLGVSKYAVYQKAQEMKKGSRKGEPDNK